MTDHKPLVWLFNVNDPGLRLIRSRFKLEEYDYEIVHKAGRVNANADALSRNVMRDEPKEKERNILAISHEQEEDSNIDTEEEEPGDTPRKYSEEEKFKIIKEYHDA